ncbi:MAG: calcium-binding protein [Pseudomonadota bacterium]|nr:calcium-binding protein [Pseudomonadota bacterium]
MTKEEIQSLLTIGTSGDDEVVGFHTHDYLDGGAGNDILRGLDGSDTYFFGRGSGNDIIRESVQYVNIDDDDRIEFASDLTLGDIVWSRSGETLIIGIAETTDTLTAEGALGVDSSLNHTWRDIEFFDFADGTTLTKSEVMSILLSPTDGDDIIDGFWTGDTLAGGLGDDLLRGGEGNDTYLYNLGDGHDAIEDYFAETGFDVLRFGDGITSSDLIFGTSVDNTSDMVIRFANAEGSVELSNQVLGGSRWGIDRVEFSDGAQLDRAQLLARYLTEQGGSADDLIGGDNNDNTLIGLGGDDFIRSLGGDDVVTGGTGNDRLEGGSGSDTYAYALGDGTDTILDAGSDAADRLVFGAGISPADVLVDPDLSDPSAMIIRFQGSSETIYTEQQWTSGAGLEFIEFADGTIWDYAGIEQQFALGEERAGSQTLTGTSGADIINGYAGNDSINGSGGDDTLIGGIDNDTVIGSTGNDTYVYNLGDGDDRFYEGESRHNSGGNDSILFGLGIELGDLTFSKFTSDWYDLHITVAGGGSIHLDEQDDNYQGRRYNRIENFIFQTLEADGSITQTTMTYGEIEALRIASSETAGADTIIGSLDADSVLGGDGNDTLYGWTGSDTIHGGSGDDYLNGGTGNDTYVYNLGDGDDRFYEGESRHNSGGNETVLFGAGITLDDIVVTRSTSNASDIVITFKNASGSIYIDGQGDSYQGRRYNRIENFTFADGSSVDHTEILARTIVVSGSTITGGTADDELTGTAASDTLVGNAGADLLFGEDGDDTLNGGLGDDLLNGGLGTDIADFAGLSTEYTIITGGGTFQLHDDETTVGEDEGTDTLIGVEHLRFGDGQMVGITSPIILDLAGDGIETLSAGESHARFDLDGDGVAADTSWIGTGEAFLYLDRDGNGTMSDAGEISFIDDAPNAASDLAGLRAFDSNGDGVLDASDERFEDFGLWQDADGDGTVDEGETVSLSNFGIGSISLAGTAVNGETALGKVAIVNTGTYTLTNGVTRGFADAALTYFSGPTSFPEIAPNLYTCGCGHENYRMNLSRCVGSIAPRNDLRRWNSFDRFGMDNVWNFEECGYDVFAPFNFGDRPVSIERSSPEPLGRRNR